MSVILDVRVGLFKKYEKNFSFFVSKVYPSIVENIRTSKKLIEYISKGILTAGVQFLNLIR